jgi:hypothetical protein
MADNDKEKRDTPPVRLCFQNAKKAQESLSRIIRARQKQKISDVDYKAIVYGFTSWLSFEKHIKECAIEKRLEALEEQIALRGEK